jgi:hypothetical protein
MRLPLAGWLLLFLFALSSLHAQRANTVKGTATGAEPIKKLRESAEAGDAVAMVDLGVLYGRGQGVEQSFVEEMHWYRAAADKGNDVAMLYLGHMYRQGHGVQQDYPQALNWYRKSAEKGNASALAMVGEMYRGGEGVPQDYAEAYFWLNLSAADPPPGTRQDRDAVARKLPRAKLVETQKRCRRWAATHPKIHFVP